MSKLSFSIALNMATSQFKKGADYVKRSLREVQYQTLAMASALGAGGLGLGNLVGRFVDVARETNKARVALKNISGDANQFASNQKFLIDLSKQYGQGLNVLTGNYAKFSAAATSAGVSVADQQKIFTSVSRGIAAFGLSADEANGTFLAISQMMSKGKVSAEELRGQLGERLPIAMAAMAKAAGVPISELDALMKKGTLLSSEVLPKFADALDSMIPSIDTDNLETSLTRLRNKFIELTDNLGVGQKYKAIVDSVAKGLDTIKNSISGLAAFVVSMFTGKLLSSVVGYFQKIRTEYLSVSADRERLLMEQSVSEGRALQASLNRMNAEKALEAEKAAYKAKAGRISFEDQKKLLHAENTLKKAKAAEERALINATAAQQKAAAAASGSVWAYTWTSFRLMALRAIASVKAILVTIAPMAIVTVISLFISKLVQARKEAKRIRDIFGEYKREMLFVGGGEEAARLRSLLSLMNDQTKSAKERNAAQSALQGMLDMEKATQQEITAEVGRRVELLKEAARADLAARKFAEAEEANRRLAGKAGLSVEQMTNLAENRGVGIVSPFSKDHDQSIKYQQMIGEEVLKSGNKGKYSASKIDEAVNEFAQNLKIISDAGETIKAAEIKKDELTKSRNITPIAPASPTDDKETDLQKAEREYVEKLQEYANKRDSSVFDTEEYNKAVDALNEATRAQIGGMLGREAVNNETFNKANAGTLNKLHKENKEAEEIEKYTNNLKELSRLKERGIIDEEEYQKRMQDISKSTLNAIGVMDGISEEGEKFIKNLKSNLPTKGDKEEKGEKQRPIGELRREVFDNINDQVSEVTSLVRAFESLNDVLKDTDASTLEKVLSIIDTIQNSIASVWDFIDGIAKVRESFEALNAVKEAGKAIDNASGVTEQIQGLNELGKTAGQVAGQVVAAKSAEATANTAAAATGAASSVASIPYIGPIMAVAAVASVLAALVSLPKFAKGGTVPGNSTTGDKILARVNSGELILNKSQQANLSKALSGNYSASNLIGRINPTVNKTPVYSGVNHKTLFNNKPNVSFPKELKFEIEGRKLVSILKAEGIRQGRM